MTRLLFFTILLASVILIQAGTKCHKCPKNEVWNPCGNHCEPQCKRPIADEDDSNYDPYECLKDCKCEKQHAGCRCKKGYLRDYVTKKCVLPKDCTKCGYGESCLPCGRKCEGTCEHPQPPNDCKDKNCDDAFCRCDYDKGYVRDESTDMCVKIDDCPCKDDNDDKKPAILGIL